MYRKKIRKVAINKLSKTAYLVRRDVKFINGDTFKAYSFISNTDEFEFYISRIDSKSDISMIFIGSIFNGDYSILDKYNVKYDKDKLSKLIYTIIDKYYNNSTDILDPSNTFNLGTMLIRYLTMENNDNMAEDDKIIYTFKPRYNDSKKYIINSDGVLKLIYLGKFDIIIIDILKKDESDKLDEYINWLIKNSDLSYNSLVDAYNTCPFRKRGPVIINDNITLDSEED